MRTLLTISLAAMLAAPAAGWAQSGSDWTVRGWEPGSSEPGWSDPELTEPGWTEGEAAPILASPLETEDIPPAEEAEPEEEGTAGYPSDETSGDWIPQKAVSAEAAATPAADTAPWDEPTTPMATAPAEWGEPPPAEPERQAPEPDYAPEPLVTDGF